MKIFTMKRFLNYSAFAVLLMAFLLHPGTARSNNIIVSNVSLVGKNTDAGVNNSANHIQVKFDLSWDNSWRTSYGPNNWDAAWVFVKFRVGNTGNWQHATLNTSGHLAASGSTIDVPADGTGAFIYRSADGSGSNNFTNTRLRWNYGANNVADDAALEIRVFAIEMVYVPQGSFFVGSGGTESGSFTNGFWTSGASLPFQINSENALTIAQTSGSLWGTGTNPENTIGGTGTLAASFPKGFAAFYSMKYEISQGQYRDFLNTLTRGQQDQRVNIGNTVGRYSCYATFSAGIWNSAAKGATTDPSNRNGLRLIADPGGSIPRIYACDLVKSTSLPDGVNQADDGEWVAYNAISWMDALAYLDWSGLRPMTELEYEKSCRGNQEPVANEYAWGTTSLTKATGISNPGENIETFANAGANCVYDNLASVSGPLRVGTFAGSGTTRAESGASYWGIMELSGNLNEVVVTVGNADGRGYTGNHGNGELAASTGNANVSGWPGTTSGEVTTNLGCGARGGSFTNRGLAQVSARDNASYRGPGDGRGDSGYRGVRTAQ
jgi:formylglycine-generating enzyme required for sulfatase activity